ncbi:hypothetical protein RJ639_021175 [Escallonia herrerae]|uniref:Cytochrome P450 n=1 Tax=Escallonia herrerae TaxID=1293975 RepID=A0AA88V6V2_9ASTE|nr:hypothetical protein RJ639_021175 [Escallonia herrerae]
MELFNLSLLILGLLLLVTFIFRSQRSNGPKLPPGKTGWPVIGEANEFVSSGRQGAPETFVNKRMQKYSPQLFKTSLAGETMAVFCGPAGNKFLFSNENKLVVSWWPPTIEKINIAKSNRSNSTILTKKMKSIIPEFVRPEALQKYVPIMDCTARKHLESEWTSPDGQVHAFPLSKKLTFALACRLFMNVEDADTVARLAANFTLVTAGLLSVPIDFPGTAFNRAVKAADLIRKDLLPIIKMRRNQVREKELNITHDLLSQLLLATDEDGKFLTEMEIVDMILGILIASHDTTSTVITFVVYYLADHPHVYALVLKEERIQYQDDFFSFSGVVRVRRREEARPEVRELAALHLRRTGGRFA